MLEISTTTPPFSARQAVFDWPNSEVLIGVWHTPARAFERSENYNREGLDFLHSFPSFLKK
jgi:hypothetical protein